MITFQFSITQGLALEFGNLYMRVLQDGAYVTEAAKNITGITNANPGVLTIVAHGYANGDWVHLAGIGGMTQLNGQTLVVANRTADTFTLKDVFGVPINTTVYGAYTAGGTAARIYTLVTPYAEVDLKYLKFTQSADVMSFTCWNQQTGTLYAPRDLARLANDNWTLTVFSTASNIAAPTGAQATPFSSDIPSTWYSYVVTAVDRETGQESLGSDVVNIENNDIALKSGSNRIGWTAVAKAASYNVYKAAPSYGSYPAAGISYGFMASSQGQNANDTNIIPDYSQTPPLHGNPFATGRIEDVVPTAGGINYAQQTIGYVITTGTGTGFEGTPVVVNGAFVGFTIKSMGADYALADTIAITDSGGGVATGNILGAVNAVDGASVLINGVTIKFRRAAAAPGYNETPLGNTLALTFQSLSNFCNSSPDVSLTVATYTYDATHLYVTYKTPGAVGNAYTLGAGTSGFTPSGANLTGGGTAGSGATATLTIGELAGTYPSTVAYFQQRRVYAGTPNEPDTYFMSQPGAYHNFDSRIPAVPTDAIIGTPWSVQVDGIQFMVPMPGGLVVLTGQQAWQLTGSGGSSTNPQPITPASQSAQPQAFNGCSDRVPPIRIDYDINYIQAKGSLFRDLSYNFYSNIYTGTDLTYLSPHLFVGHEILEMAWCEEPFRLVWATRDDGILLSLTYFKQQEVMAWARHDTNGQYWSVCSVTEPPVDALYLVSERITPAGTAYMVERMDNRLWPANENCWCVDAGLSTTLTNPAASLTASSSTGAGIPTGITGLAGGGGYSAATTATIEDPTGAGAVVNLTIAGGVITAIGFVGGANYTYPVLVFTDPAGTGQGAAATVTLDNSATFRASAAVFSGGDVGRVLRMGGGIATITAYHSNREVVADITAPIAQTIPNSGGIPEVAAQGNWSIASKVNSLNGFWHLIGAQVVGLADGVPFGPVTVSASGAVPLPFAASLAVAGLAFTPQMQSLDLDTGTPTIQAQRGKLAAVSVRLEASGVGSITVGANQPDGSAQSPVRVDMPWGRAPSNPLTPLVLPVDQDLPPFGSNIIPLWTGDCRVPISGGYAKPKQVALQQNVPLPMQVLALVPEFLGGDTPQTGARSDGDQQQQSRGGGWGPQGGARAAR